MRLQIILDDLDLERAQNLGQDVFQEYLGSFFNSGRVRTVKKYDIILIQKNKNILGMHAHLRVLYSDKEQGYVTKSTKISY